MQQTFLANFPAAVLTSIQIHWWSKFNLVIKLLKIQYVKSTVE